MKTIGSWIVILTIFGTVYYAADKVLTQVEATVNATVTSNVKLIKRHAIDTGISTGIVTSGVTFGQAIASGDLSLTQNLSGADKGNLHSY